MAVVSTLVGGPFAGGGDGWMSLSGYPLTLGADAQTVSISTTLDTYREVRISAWCPEQAGSHNITMRLNGSATGVTYGQLQCTGAAVSAAGGSEFSGCSAGGASTIEIYFPTIRSGKRRHAHARTTYDGGASFSLMRLASICWNNTAAITQIELVSSIATGFKSGAIIDVQVRT